MRKDTLTPHALWTPITVSTAPQEISFTAKQTDTVDMTTLLAQSVALVVISVQVLCAWIAFAAVWVATNDEKKKYTFKHKTAHSLLYACSSWSYIFMRWNTP